MLKNEKKKIRESVVFVHHLPVGYLYYDSKSEVNCVSYREPL